MSNRGRFITFEGGEGAGKSSQVTLLSNWLRSNGIDCVTTREPGGSLNAELIRNLLVAPSEEEWDPIAEALLHFAARRQHVSRTIEPALAEGNWVISDRFADSTAVYQGIALSAGRSLVDELYRLTIAPLRPAMTVIIDVPVEVGMARAVKRGEDPSRYELLDKEFHEAVRRGFQTLAAREPDRCILVDGARDVDRVFADVKDAVCARLEISPS